MRDTDKTPAQCATVQGKDSPCAVRERARILAAIDTTRPTFADRYVYAARCVQVIDGDTLDLDIDLGFHIRATKRVRLKGIDTPELRGKDKHRAVAARTEVTIWTDGVELLIRTELDKTDKYGRLLADIWVDMLATSLSDHLVERGMARRYDGGTR